jgi:hypothetical protein
MDSTDKIYVCPKCGVHMATNRWLCIMCWSTFTYDEPIYNLFKMYVHGSTDNWQEMRDKIIDMWCKGEFDGDYE